jgi:hypothetical protein
MSDIVEVAACITDLTFMLAFALNFSKTMFDYKKAVISLIMLSIIWVTANVYFLDRYKDTALTLLCLIIFYLPIASITIGKVFNSSILKIMIGGMIFLSANITCNTMALAAWNLFQMRTIYLENGSLSIKIAVFSIVKILDMLIFIGLSVLSKKDLICTPRSRKYTLATIFYGVITITLMTLTMESIKNIKNGFLELVIILLSSSIFFFHGDITYLLNN